MVTANKVSTVVMNNWKFGDYGDFGGRNAPEGSFSGLNVLVYANGSVGPRPGFGDSTPASMPTGKILGFLLTNVVDREGFFIIGNTVRRFSTTTLAAPSTVGTLGTTPTALLSTKLQPEAKVLIAVPGTGGAVYTANVSADTVTALTGSPRSKDVEQYGQQVLALADDTPYRLWYSAVNDPNSWPAGNFTDIGDNYSANAVLNQGNGVTIFKEQGVYVLQGVPGSDSEIVRRPFSGEGVLSFLDTSRDQQERIHFRPWTRVAPATFNGQSPAYDQFLQWFTYGVRNNILQEPPAVTGVVSFNDDMAPTATVMLQGSSQNKMIIQHNGAWTRHSTSVDITGLASPYPSGLGFITTDGGNTGVAAKFWRMELSADRPAFVSDGINQPGDNSTTPVPSSFSTREWWNPDGTEIAIRKVIVEFDRWDTGITNPTNYNHFDIEITMLTKFHSNPSTPGTNFNLTTQSWNQNPNLSAATAVGTPDRAVFEFKKEWGGGFVIKANNLRGVAIKGYRIEIENNTDISRA